MRSKNTKPGKKRNTNKKKNASIQSHEFETMSQAQNRYGNGRQRSGSDGGNGNNGFSNH